MIKLVPPTFVSARQIAIESQLVKENVADSFYAGIYKCIKVFFQKTSTLFFKASWSSISNPSLPQRPIRHWYFLLPWEYAITHILVEKISQKNRPLTIELVPRR